MQHLISPLPFWLPSCPLLFAFIHPPTHLLGLLAPSPPAHLSLSLSPHLPLSGFFFCTSANYLWKRKVQLILAAAQREEKADGNIKAAQSKGPWSYRWWTDGHLVEHNLQADTARRRCYAQRRVLPVEEVVAWRFMSNGEASVFRSPFKCFDRTGFPPLLLTELTSLLTLVLINFQWHFILEFQSITFADYFFTLNFLMNALHIFKYGPQP